MEPKVPAYEKEELLLRKIFDLFNESLNKKNESKIYYIQDESYKNIKINFNPTNKYKERAKNFITKISF